MSLDVLLNSENVLPFLLSVFAASAMAVQPGNTIVYRLHFFLSNKFRTRAGITADPVTEHDSPGAEFIGYIERPLYVFAIMFLQPGIITAVIILKAFFNWTDVFVRKEVGETLAADTGEAAKNERTAGFRRMIANYHAYVIGNLLSLLVALILAVVSRYGLFPLLKGWGIGGVSAQL